MMATFNNNNGNLLPAITCRRTKFPSPNPLNTSIVTSITAVSTTTIAASSSIVTAMATAAPVSCTNNLIQERWRNELLYYR